MAYCHLVRPDGANMQQMNGIALWIPSKCFPWFVHPYSHTTRY